MRFGRPAAAGGGKASQAAKPSLLLRFWFHVQSSIINVFVWDMVKDERGPKAMELAVAMVICVNYVRIGDSVSGRLLLTATGVFVAIRLASWFLFAVLLANLCMNSRAPREAPYVSMTVVNWQTAICLRAVFRCPFHVDGTHWVGPLFLLFGAKVGRGLFSADGERCLIDPHFSHIGDDVTFDHDARMRQHSFEDMKLKWGSNSIGRGATIQRSSVLAMSDAGEGAVLQCSSVTWKGQILQPNKRYQGTPAVEVQAPRGPAHQAEKL